MLSDKLFEKVIVKKYLSEDGQTIRMSWLAYHFYNVIFSILDVVEKIF